MRFLCYALILCLSILFPVSIIAAETQTTGNTPVENVVPESAASTETVNPPPADETGNKGAIIGGEPLPGTAPAPASTQPGSEASSTERDRQGVLTSLLSKLVNSYNDLNAKYADLSAKYEKLRQEIAASTAAREKQSIEAASNVQKETEKAKSAEPVTAPEQVTSYAVRREMPQEVNAPNEEQKPAAETTAAVTPEKTETAKNEVKMSGGDMTAQYVKLKLQEDGREVEFMLDPMYVDMNFNFKRSTATLENKQETSAQLNVQPQQPPVAAPIQQQTPPPLPQQPQIQYAPYPQQQLTPPQPLQQPQTPAATLAEVQQKQQQPGQSETIGTRDVLDGIYRAQKYYYDKRYNDALKAVQNSLLAKETALGYALEGSIYYTLGDINAAVRSWRSALRLNPDMEDVRAALERYAR